MYKYLILILVFSSASAQDLKKDLKMMMEKITALQDFDLNSVATVKYMDTTLRAEKIKVRIAKYEDKFYRSEPYNLTISDGKNIVSISDEDKLIIYKKAKPEDLSLAEGVSNFELLDMAVSDLLHWEFRGEKDGIFEYVMMEREKLIHLVHLYLDKNSFLPVRIRLDYNESLQNSLKSVDVIYEFKILKTCPANIFDLKSYIGVKGSVISPAPKYAKYKVITLT